MLAREADELVHIGHHAFQGFRGRLVWRGFEKRHQPQLAVFLARFVHRFHDAISENEKQVA